MSSSEMAWLSMVTEIMGGRSSPDLESPMADCSGNVRMPDLGPLSSSICVGIRRAYTCSFLPLHAISHAHA
jgi:hypothetical protein